MSVDDLWRSVGGRHILHAILCFVHIFTPVAPEPPCWFLHSIHVQLIFLLPSVVAPPPQWQRRTRSLTRSMHCRVSTCRLIPMHCPRESGRYRGPQCGLPFEAMTPHLYFYGIDHNQSGPIPSFSSGTSMPWIRCSWRCSGGTLGQGQHLHRSIPDISQFQTSSCNPTPPDGSPGTTPRSSCRISRRAR